MKEPAQLSREKEKGSGGPLLRRSVFRTHFAAPNQLPISRFRASLMEDNAEVSFASSLPVGSAFAASSFLSQFPGLLLLGAIVITKSNETPCLFRGALREVSVLPWPPTPSARPCSPRSPAPSRDFRDPSSLFTPPSRLVALLFCLLHSRAADSSRPHDGRCPESPSGPAPALHM